MTSHFRACIRRRGEMRDRDVLAKRFEEQRPQLRRIAYRMLGTVDEADDAVQEAWIRLSRTDDSSVENLGAWLTTVVSRVCLDMLRTRRSRREDFVGSWMPEPIVAVGEEPSPEDEALIDGLVPAGHPSTPGYNDPAYPIEGRLPQSGR